MNYEELRKKIRNLIYVEWDPIGVAGIDGAEDEYRMYETKIFSMIKGEKSAQELFDYLRYVEVDQMGLENEETNAKRVAQMMQDLFLQYKDERG